MDCGCSGGGSPSPQYTSPFIPAAVSFAEPPSRGAASYLGRRAVGIAQWALPITALAIVPKCPGCIAAYVLLFTGVGMSWSVASAARWTMIISGITALLFLMARIMVTVVKQARQRASAG